MPDWHDSFAAASRTCFADGQTGNVSRCPPARERGAMKDFFAVQRKQEMTCEEFEAIGLDAERDASLSEVERVAVRGHAGTCSRCAGLQDSWQAAGLELRAFAEDTAMTQAPAR